jgi:hypothetical protein
MTISSFGDSTITHACHSEHLFFVILRTNTIEKKGAHSDMTKNPNLNFQISNKSQSLKKLNLKR